MKSTHPTPSGKIHRTPSHQGHYTPLDVISTEALLVGVFLSLLSAGVVALLIYFGTHTLHQLFEPLVQALNVHSPKGL